MLLAQASFTDADGMVTREFVAKMSELDSSNSMKDDFCIEKYLIRQEKVHPFTSLYCYFY